MIKIRKMEKDDLAQVMEIETQAYGEHHWSRDSFCNELENNLYKRIRPKYSNILFI